MNALKTEVNAVLDEVDREILSLIVEDSRKSYREIAKTLGISVGTAYNRVKRLEESRIIKAYTALVDHAKIGYELTALILIQAEGGHLLNVEAEAAKLDAVACVYDITGDFDIAIIARFKNSSELNTFIKSMLKNPYVRRTVTNVVLNIVKEDLRVKVPRKPMSQTSSNSPA